jgi:hypothetical protein
MLKISEDPFPKARSVTPATLCFSEKESAIVAREGTRKSTMAVSQMKSKPIQASMSNPERIRYWGIKQYDISK